MDQKLKNQILYMADRMREDALFMAYCAGGKAAHLGGGLSSIDILATLYGTVMQLDPKNPEWKERDRFVLSKGHGVLGYYAALAQKGFLSRDELRTFEQDGSILLGHPIINRKKGIEFTTGSLGMGLSLGIGVSLAIRKQMEAGKRERLSQVYVLLGDGECNEGSVWEAFLSATQYNLDHITAIIDRNHFQLGGETKNVMDIGNMAEKLRAFGWDVYEVDGHDVEAVYDALQAPVKEGMPKAIVADTIKGKGFSFCENNNAWHHAVVTKEQYEKALEELHGKMQIDENASAITLDDDTNTIATVNKSYDQEGSKAEETIIKVSRSLARRWSMVGQRAAFGLAAVELAKTNDRLMALTGDVSTSAGLERMKKNHPGQFLDIGIAEQNMMGIAAGLASEGYDIITATFAPFQSMRCLEQIRVNLGYMGNKVTMVGLASGVVLGTLGNTHCCFEDIGVLRSIPNIAIVSPADCIEVGKALEAAIKYPQSVYIRLIGGATCPIIYNEDYTFEIGKAVMIKELPENVKGSRDVITLIANGSMVEVASKAAEILEENGVLCEVMNMHTIKPIDIGAIKSACNNSKLIVTIEEHNRIGGLGSAVAEVIAGQKNVPELQILGLKDEYGHGGEYETILEKNGLTVDDVVDSVKNSLHIQ